MILLIRLALSSIVIVGGVTVRVVGLAGCAWMT